MQAGRTGCQRTFMGPEKACIISQSELVAALHLGFSQWELILEEEKGLHMRCTQRCVCSGF